MLNSLTPPTQTKSSDLSSIARAIFGEAIKDLTTHEVNNANSKIYIVQKRPLHDFDSRNEQEPGYKHEERFEHLLTKVAQGYGVDDQTSASR